MGKTSQVKQHVWKSNMLCFFSGYFCLIRNVGKKTKDMEDGEKTKQKF